MTSWFPFRDLTAFRREFDRLLDDLLADREGRSGLGAEWAPALDLAEGRDQFVVRVELAGVDPKEIEITVSGGTLTIQGERKLEREEKDGHYHRMERSYGPFLRTVRLPSAVEEEKVKAQYKDGVLKITIPKPDEAKKKKMGIEIQSEPSVFLR
jgi:HSP20 family protein